MTDKSQLIAELERMLGTDGVIQTPEGLETYGKDWTTVVPAPPDVAVLPRTSEQVESAMKLAAELGMPVVARGAGTGLAGGARPDHGGMVISTERMTDVLDVDVPNRRATVQPGLINYDLSQHLAPFGYFYAPDPASWQICTIGGNIANNSGGPHCLKYGVTTNHVLALELVMHDGHVIWTGDGLLDAAGYDLTGIVIGSEGTFGVVSRALVRIMRRPEAIRLVLALFPSMVRASEAVSAVIACGCLPTSLEAMDRTTIRAVNLKNNYGLPETADAALIIEVDGVEHGLDGLLDTITGICMQHGAIQVVPARSAEEQARVWAARKSAFASFDVFAPAYYLVDSVVPRTRLPYMMEQVERLSRQYQMPIANVFHAGDGNLHPLVLYDPAKPDEVERAHAITEEVLRLSIEQGGAVTGEHGIGVEKRDFLLRLFNEHEIQAMAALYAIFNPDDRLNPGKVFPSDVPPLQRAHQRTERIAATQGIDGMADLDSRLEQIVGAEYLLHGAEAERYSVQGHAPGCAVLPADAAQVAAVLAACHGAGATVVPWGGGTQQGYGTLSVAPDVVLVLRRLAGIVHYDPDDLVISVGAGTTVAELQAILAPHNQMLPLEVPAPEHATLGGLVATATDGPRRVVYGTLRDIVTGLEVVEVDGTPIRCGGRVVKNVSGYDMCKLFHGSHGTLGVITTVTLRTFPVLNAASTLLLTFADRDGALAFIADLATTQLTPTAVEFLDRGALERIGVAGVCGVAVRVEGVEAACQRHVRDLRTLAAQHNAASISEHSGQTGDTDLWAHIVACAGSHARQPGEVLIRLVVPPADLGDALEHLEVNLAQHGTLHTTIARAHNGVIYTRAQCRGADLHALQQALVRRWGHSHILACDPADRAGLPVWGAPPISLDLMRQLKTTFDPAGTLNPGRYVIEQEV